jgi:hypothetical protein
MTTLPMLAVLAAVAGASPISPAPYQATATGEVGDAEMAHLAGLVSKVYDKGDFVGSLVVPGPGDARRPTAWDAASTAPANVAWWDFPGLVERWWKHAARRDGIGVR